MFVLILELVRAIMTLFKLSHLYFTKNKTCDLLSTFFYVSQTPVVIFSRSMVQMLHTASTELPLCFVDHISANDR